MRSHWRGPSISVGFFAAFSIIIGILAPSMVSAASLWPTAVPTNITTNDPSAVEVGLKFTSDQDGYVTGVRFYKGPSNTGTHIGNLWTVGGTNLATVTFANESASGWQQADFANPVAIAASTTYVISYFAPNGSYSNDGAYFTVPFDNAPLHAPSSAASGGNGVYGYGSASLFPTNTFNAVNYWVDPIFSDVPATTTPVISAFSANPTTIVQGGSSTLSWGTTGATTLSIDHGVGTVTGTSVSVAPMATTTYTLTATNNIGSATATVSVGVTPPPPPAPNPILVVTYSGNKFSQYYGEILRTEGFNQFSTVDISNLTSSILSGFDEVILSDMPLGGAEVTMLTDWVNAGGNLIAMRPDKDLANLLGLTDASGTLADAYMGIDTTQAPGIGIVSETIQYHSLADLYTLNGARAIATLYANATTSTANPAVTTRRVGAGSATAFAFDLARSIVYTRQGNPAWAGQERDNDSIGVIRADDMFYPNYLDLDKVAIPQADEMQRLLANILTSVSIDSDKAPLPHFWYFPSMYKAIIVASSDDHATANGTKTFFDQLLAASPSGCAVGDWTCYRATSWIYTSTPLSSAEADQYEAQGFDIGSHINTGCSNYSSQAQLNSLFVSDLAAFRAKYTGLPLQTGNRTHCIPWSDWSSTPKVELAQGIRFDMNYYYWPGAWVQNRPGFMTGSGIPMRFADQDGTMIDVFQQASHLVNENGVTYPDGINAMLDKALGAEGYYGAFGTHYDFSDNFPSQMLSAVQAHGGNVPMVTADQMLKWVDGRNASTFGTFSWDGAVLSFTATAATSAHNIYALLPATYQGRSLLGLTVNASAVSFATSTIKGIAYATFPVQSGAYVATYTAAPDTAPPSAPTNLNASAVSSSAIDLTWTASTDNVAVTGYKVFRNGTLVGTTTGISYADTGLAASTTYGYTVRAFDGAGNVSASSSAAGATTLPAYANYSLFTTQTPVLTEQTDGVGVNYELGVKFQSNAAGLITAIRFYKTSSETGTHTGHIWSSNGTELASVIFSGETSSGWQTQDLTSPLSISANTTYTVSVNTGNTYYVATDDGLQSSVANGPLSTVVGGNGTYGSVGTFPTNTYQASNYFRDVVISVPIDTTPPSAPTNLNASAVSSSAIDLTWTASTDNVAVTGYKVFRNGTLVGTTTGISYADTGLAASTTYGYTVRAFDGAGNVSASSSAAGATTLPASTQLSLWPSEPTPTTPADSDTASVEIGVKFTSDIAGKISAIKFYKDTTNTGTHVVHLWSSTGTLLGVATATGETSSGWQTVTFGAPVDISANTTYVASYLAPNGHYAGDNGYFASGVDSDTLHAPSDASSGGNGVYTYTGNPSGAFPTASWESSNYWVDVIFHPD